jgi:hypothetical protein
MIGKLGIRLPTPLSRRNQAFPTGEIALWDMDHSLGVSPGYIYNTANANSLSLWPASGYVGNVATFVPGLLGNAVSFTRVSSQVISMPNNVLNYNQSFSMSFWVWFNDITTAHNPIFETRDTDDPLEILGLVHCSGSGLRVRIYTGGGETLTNAPSANITAGAWWHVVWVRDVTAGTMQIWQNNSRVLNQSFNPTFVHTSGWSSTRLGYYSYATSYFDGKMDQIRLYQRTLTAIEIGLLYNYGLGA